MDEYGDLLVRYKKKNKLADNTLPDMKSLLLAIDHPEEANPAVLEYLKQHPDLEDKLRMLREDVLDS